MNNPETDLLNEKEKEFKKKILELETENLSNISKLDDRSMVSKIIRSFEEEFKK